MSKTFLLTIVAMLFLTVSSSFVPTDAAAIHPSQSLAPVSAETDQVDLVRRLRNRRARQTAGVGVFIVPGIYWGPAWWDANFRRVCWKLHRHCRNCAQNWIYVC